MKIKEIPYDMSTETGEDFFEIPRNMEEMKKGISFLHQKLKEVSTEEEKAVLLSLTGSYSRTANELEDSKKHLEQAILIYESLEKKSKQVSVKIQLARTLHRLKKMSKSDQIYLQLLDADDDQIEAHRDYVLYHYGLNKFHQKFFEEALKLLLESLEIRLIKGDMKLIESTKLLIESIRQKLTN